MNSKPWIIVASVIVALVLVTGSCSAGFIAGRVYTTQSNPLMGSAPLTLNPSPSGRGGTPDNLTELFSPFWQTWDIVVEQYVAQPVDQEAMMRGAIRGMLEALEDEHTSYMDPVTFEQANAELRGDEYEGIGAWVDTSKDYLTIISPMPGSPAEKAGLKPDDKIIAIDGEDMTGVDGELARQKVLGPKGSTVTLTVQRKDLQPFDVEVVRDSIVVPTMESRMLENDIAYVRLIIFGEDTADNLKEALEELMKQNPKGLILDLRYNGGGFLDTAIDVASQFVGDGVIMYEEYGDGNTITYEARSGGVATKVPMVVLINEGSASASEIVAGAIQDRGRGVLVGVTSYGKGSVQTFAPLVNEQGAVRVTIARWLTPNNRQINGVGLEPDYLVEFTEADIEAGKDVQLEKAIELLTQ